MQEFKDHQVPLSVCIVDMDWHITQTGNHSSGWTGYTWNRELFPDPLGFIAELHALGLKHGAQPAPGGWRPSRTRSSTGSWPSPWAWTRTRGSRCRSTSPIRDLSQGYFELLAPSVRGAGGRFLVAGLAAG